jgi:type IX secretion system PorP/SprF family membrane protein
MRKSFLILLLLSSMQPEVFSQDPVFTQPYMSQVYLNPAATGSGDHDLRFSAIFRRQWWATPSKFSYGVFSVDKFIPALQGGIGLMATTSSEGYLKKTGIHASYAYTFCPGGENGNLPKWFLSGAFQFGYVQRRIDYNDLLFIDQIDAGGIIPGVGSAADLPVNSRRWYPDAGAGLLFNYRMKEDRNRLLVGISARHINRPDESLIGTNDANRSIVPLLWSANFMYSGPLAPDWTYSFVGNYSKQQKNQLIQAGVEVTQNVIDIGLGLWYRAGGFQNPDAVGISLKFNLSGQDNTSSKIRAGIAHDANVGGLKYSNNNGSSELGITWDQDTYKTNSNSACKPFISSGIPCPKY